MPARNHPYPPLAVSVDAAPAATLTLPELPAYLEALDDQPFSFRTMVFTGDRLPIGRFENPLGVEDIIGPYTVTTQYYDADFNLVTHADKPGRYGAVVETNYGNHEVYRKYFTLYKPGPTFDWHKLDFPVKGELPPTFGLDLATAHKQSEPITDEYNQLLREAVRKDQDMAVLLAGLSEVKNDPDTSVIHIDHSKRSHPGVEQLNPVYANDMKWWASLKHKLGIKHQNYLIYLPKGFDPASTVRHGRCSSLCMDPVRAATI